MHRGAFNGLPRGLWETGHPTLGAVTHDEVRLIERYRAEAAMAAAAPSRRPVAEARLLERVKAARSLLRVDLPVLLARMVERRATVGETLEAVEALLDEALDGVGRAVANSG